ncbi:MAG: CheR family methyltransferase [Campylobacterota bacterium]|nr:CheR family methyltransferase [Campylobacterota bacterium]
MSRYQFPHSKFKDFMILYFGISLKGENELNIERKLKKICYELKFKSVDECISKITDSPSSNTLDIISKHFLINESYFFRDLRCFETLENDILKKLISKRAKSGEKYLRIWSAGCSCGEEPYSISILLHKLIPDIKSWNIRILATDINPENLQKAKKGIYTLWSLRDTPKWVKENYFIEEDKHFKIISNVKELVVFKKQNLVEDIFSDFLFNTKSIDIILCRNVMIYFDQKKSEDIVNKFYDCLADEGYLIIAPAEASVETLNRFNVTNFKKGTFYQKKRIDTREEVQVDFYENKDDEPVVIADKTVDKTDISTKEEINNTENVLNKIKTLANRGDFRKALDECEILLENNKNISELYYIYGLLLCEIGEYTKAIEAFKYTLYLDQEFIVAYIAFGSLLQTLNRAKDAERYYTKAYKLLKSLDPAAIVKYSEGLTAGYLLQMIPNNRKRGR